MIDDRPPFRDVFAKQSDRPSRQQAKLDKRVGEVTKECRLNGIRPMTIGKLLAYLGYDMNSPILGRTEAVDPNAMRRLTSTPAAQAAEGPAQGGDRPEQPRRERMTPTETKKDDDAAAKKDDATEDDEPSPRAEEPRPAAKEGRLTKKKR